MGTDEVPPPWVMHPGYPPADAFWRQSGEAWFTYVWRPYWETLTPLQQEEYLERWKVPQEWSLFYFDQSFQAWLESTDD